MRSQRFIPLVSSAATFLLLTSGAVAGAYVTELTPFCEQSWTIVDILEISAGSDVLWHIDPEDDGEAEWIVIVLQNSQGQTTLTINPESITFSGTCRTLDTASVAGFFDNLALETIRQTVDSGVIKTSENPMNPAEIEVYTPTCVYILGAGEGTIYANVAECTQGIRYIRYANPQGIFDGTIYATSGEDSCSSGVATITDDGGLQ